MASKVPNRHTSTCECAYFRESRNCECVEIFELKRVEEVCGWACACQALCKCVTGMLQRCNGGALYLVVDLDKERPVEFKRQGKLPETTEAAFVMGWSES